MNANKFLIIAGCLIIGATFGCSQKTKKEQTQSLLVEEPTEEASDPVAIVYSDTIPLLKKKAKLVDADMTAAKLCGLYGQVKTVEYGDGKKWEFKKSGEYLYPEKLNKSDAKFYTGFKKFIYSIQPRNPDDDFWDENTGGRRVKELVYISETGEEDIGIYGQYLFDYYGRIDRFLDGADSCDFLYTYKSADAFPSSYKYDIDDVSEHLEDDAVYLAYSKDEYEYLKVDEHSNWLERKVTTTHVYQHKDRQPHHTKKAEPFIETRKITYYDNEE